MSETILVQSRANPGIKYAIVTGTIVITHANGETEKDSSAITFDPVHSEEPKLIGLDIEKVVETGAPDRGAAEAEVKAGTTIAATGVTFTSHTVDPNGGGKTVAITYRYTLAGKIYD